MTENIANLLNQLRERGYRANRTDAEADTSWVRDDDDALLVDAQLLAAMLSVETPVLIEGDSIGFHRSVKRTPQGEERPLPGRGLLDAGNITPNYARVIHRGFGAILQEISGRRAVATPEQAAFYDAATVAIRAVLEFSRRYAEAAQKAGNGKLAQALRRVPHDGAVSFYEACVFLKLILFTLRCNRNNHVTLGRFDQYMYPFYLHDRENGVEEEDLFETLEEFFLSINFDTDLYAGVQQGDNGQSMVLGGVDAQGRDAVNPLTYLCMRASLELNLIDPKINLRVSKETPFDLFLLGTQLTQKGLGFPQYCNDDVVIPGLQKLGYALEDARNYTVAACWEYIAPNCGMDIPNIATMNFPRVVREAVCEVLPDSKTFEDLMQHVIAGVGTECDRLVEQANRNDVRPSPYLSVFIDGCLEQGRDVSDNAARYNNSGCHGAGIANAADALAAIRQGVFEERTVDRHLLLQAMDGNFEGQEELRHRLLDCPKMGNNDDAVDGIACRLMEAFAVNMNGKPNNRGGIFRAGTGSAMEYLWSARGVGATADGKRAGEPYGSSFSPSLLARLNGPLSVLQSFTKFDMTRIINGGPLTMEVHDTTFRNATGVEKVARLVKAFIDLGGHQLQLNAINREQLLDAQKHPENHRNLIVRVWGWSGYFNELAPEYQQHIIRRTEFQM